MEDLNYSNQEFFKFKNLKAIRLKNQQKQNFKGGITIARLDNNVLCNIEMQVVKYSNIEKRIMYYWSKLYAGEIHEGEDYNT